jgi:hypothetical protein
MVAFEPSPQPAQSPARAAAVEDFATGLGQAIMGVRDAIDRFDQAGVLLDPVDGTLEEYSAELLDEARRATDEVEARLPKLRLSVGVSSPAAEAAGRAVEALRESLLRVRFYIRQPGEGEAWSHEELDAAKALLDEVRELERRFLAAVS